MSLYPLKFEPIYKEKVWGGRKLESIGKKLPPGKLIGESWELADLSQTSVGGAGGNAERSIIANGPLAGKTLHQLIKQFGPKLTGQLQLSEQGDFPILLKYLDANAPLSIQVHPPQEYVDTHNNAFLKCEAWYIVNAEPDATIYKGVKQGVTPQQFHKAIENNTIEDLVIAVPVKAGDIHFLPPGTCHALNSGALVAEVQTPSDTTFRAYDWGRTDRQLHIEKALQCIHFGPADTSSFEPNTTIKRDKTTVTTLVHSQHFHIERIIMASGYEQNLSINHPTLWMVLDGNSTLSCSTSDCRETTIKQGDTIMLPPTINDLAIHIQHDTTLLEITFPAIMSNMIA